MNVSPRVFETASCARAADLVSDCLNELNYLTK